MTGHGKGVKQADQWRVEVEISTVNRKQLDVQVRMPKGTQALESLLVTTIQDRINRGRVQVDVRIEQEKQSLALVPDKATLKETLEQLREMGEELGLPDQLTWADVLKLPAIWERRDEALNLEVLKPVLLGALTQALDELVSLRRTEGAALKQDLCERLNTLMALHNALEARAPQAFNEHADRLRNRLKDADLPVDLDDPRFLKELAIFAERTDITEELTRLKSHFEQVQNLFDRSGSVGRTLDFLAQEMFREMNTIGSKSQDAIISKHMIEFKAELEKFREQVQNIE